MRSNSLFIQRDPFREFESLFRQAFSPTTVEDTAFTPAAEAHREGDDAVIRLELPGVDVANDLSVEVLGRELVISGERRDERAEERDGRRLQEFRYGSFRRVFGLGRPLSADAVTASYDAGVLTVRVAGAYAEATGQRIAVTTPATAPSLESGSES
jgi:HSP20 family molecular chaperone IbpA